MATIRNGPGGSCCGTCNDGIEEFNGRLPSVYVGTGNPTLADYTAIGWTASDAFLADPINGDLVTERHVNITAGGDLRQERTKGAKEIRIDFNLDARDINNLLGTTTRLYVDANAGLTEYFYADLEVDYSNVSVSGFDTSGYAEVTVTLGSQDGVLEVSPTRQIVVDGPYDPPSVFLLQICIEYLDSHPSGNEAFIRARGGAQATSNTIPSPIICDASNFIFDASLYGGGYIAIENTGSNTTYLSRITERPRYSDCDDCDEVCPATIQIAIDGNDFDLSQWFLYNSYLGGGSGVPAYPAAIDVEINGSNDVEIDTWNYSGTDYTLRLKAEYWCSDGVASIRLTLTIPEHSFFPSFLNNFTSDDYEGDAAREETSYLREPFDTTFPATLAVTQIWS